MRIAIPEPSQIIGADHVTTVARLPGVDRITRARSSAERHLYRMSRRELGLLILISLIGLGVRLYRLGDWSFWIDEIITVKVVSGEFTRGGLTYGLIKPVFQAFGSDPWLMRIVPAVIGAVTIPVMFLLVRRIATQNAAIITSLLLALSPWHLYFSQNARYYALYLLLTSLTAIAFFYGIEHDEPKYLVLSVLGLALATYERSYALLLVPAAILYLLLLITLPFDKPAGLRPRNILPIAGVLLIALVAFLAEIAIQGENSFLISQITALMGRFLGKQTMQPDWLLTNFPYRVGYPVHLMATVGALILLARRSRLGLFLTLTSWVPLVMVMVLSLGLRTFTRYAASSLPMIAILAAIGFLELWRLAAEKKRVVLAIVATMILLLAIDPLARDVTHHLGNLAILVPSALVAVTVVPLIVRQNAGARSLADEHSIGPYGDSVRGIPFRARVLWQLLQRTWLELAVVLGIAIPLFSHPIVADILYFERQHGYRDNWVEIARIVEENAEAGEQVMSNAIGVARFYLGDAAVSLASDPSALPARTSRIWLVEDPSMEEFGSTSLGQWATEACQLIANADNYAAGRNWILRLHVCSIDKSS